jgi:hypothetical protein
MKKTLLTICFLGAVAVSAFPFRTSCGVVLNATPPPNCTASEMQIYLSGMNVAQCGTFVHPSSIQIYTH